jgi:uncharacterized lipoprotein YddW (UPF0748 family)
VIHCLPRSGHRYGPSLTTMIFLVVLLVPGHFPVTAQTLKHEMRGVWVTTVYNLDWPLSSDREAPPSVQRASMAQLFDELARSGMNSVFFQIRSESDAMYDSPLEPWSRFLTGTQGQAPDPLWDPLEEAIRLAHERGMELHAWLNPFRAVSALGKDGLAANHVVLQHPEWILDVTYKGTEEDKKGSVITILDPGNPQARAWIVTVIDDLVSRYDLDGIHFDDYYYPYPPYAIGMEDEATFDTYGNDFSSMEDWRRANVNAFMDEVSEAIRVANPGVKFGVSPIGIWRNGVPYGIVGLDTYNVVYADALTWMAEDDVDYLVPQLYWPFGGGQDFAALADWWAVQGRGIHIYPGIAAFKADPSTASGNLFSPDEIPEQISFGRVTSGIQGNVFFRARNLGSANNQGLTARLMSDFYRHKAITPVMTYKNFWQPESPTNLQVVSTSEGRYLTWDPPLADAISAANRFAIYRTPSDGSDPDPLAISNAAENLIHISWDPEWTDTEALAVGQMYHYVVTGLTPNSYESGNPEVTTITVQSTATDVFADSPALGNIDIYPNPVSLRARFELVLDLPVDVEIRIVDILGREVARPVSSGRQSVGILSATWDLTSRDGLRVAPGVYQVVIRAGQSRAVRSLVVVP